MRLVKDGDTLRGLVRDVYGFVDKDLIDTVKQSNPLIFDVDRIRAGSTIFFPELGKQGSRQTTNQSFEVPHD
jgi:phage tail protein X